MNERGGRRRGTLAIVLVGAAILSVTLLKVPLATVLLVGLLLLCPLLMAGMHGSRSHRERPRGGDRDEAHREAH